MISDKLVNQYRSGLSLTDISKQTGKAVNTIRDILIRAGVELRPNVSAPVSSTWRESWKRNILPYYGFCYFQGRVVKDPREYENLLLIYHLWKSGANPNSIATHLNSKKVPARRASSWNRNSVVNILKRFEDGTIYQKGGELEFI